MPRIVDVDREIIAFWNEAMEAFNHFTKVLEKIEKKYQSKLGAEELYMSLHKPFVFVIDGNQFTEDYVVGLTGEQAETVEQMDDETGKVKDVRVIKRGVNE